MLQGTARWVVSGFAAALAAFLARLSLENIGTLHSARIAGSAVAAAAAAGAALLVVYRAAAVLTLPHQRTADLSARIVEALRKAVQHHAEGPPDAAKVAAHDDVLAAIHDERRVLFSSIGANDLHEALELHKTARHRLAAAGPDASARASVTIELQNINEALANAGDVARLALLRPIYKRLMRSMLPCSLTILVGVLVFAWLTSPPSPSRTLRIDEPTPATILLSPDTPASSLGLGEDCTDRGFDGMLVGGTFDEPEAVIRPDPGSECEAGRITLSSDVGLAIPETR
jgi:hypothetical protein